MNTIAFYKTEINNILTGFDLNQAAELYSVLKLKSKLNNQEKRNLSGIWNEIKNDELEQDLKIVRQEIYQQIETKYL